MVLFVVLITMAVAISIVAVSRTTSFHRIESLHDHALIPLKRR